MTIWLAVNHWLIRRFWSFWYSIETYTGFHLLRPRHKTLRILTICREMFISQKIFLYTRKSHCVRKCVRKSRFEKYLLLSACTFIGVLVCRGGGRLYVSVCRLSCRDAYLLKFVFVWSISAFRGRNLDYKWNRSWFGWGWLNCSSLFIG